MGRLKTLPPRLGALGSRVQFAPTPSEKRMTGRALQRRRQRIWVKDPHCADCGRVTSYPEGFELDHRVALHLGGEDVDDNCQVLCSGPDGCHARKTARDAGHRRGRDRR